MSDIIFESRDERSNAYANAKFRHTLSRALRRTYTHENIGNTPAAVGDRLKHAQGVTCPFELSLSICHYLIYIELLL